MPGELPLLKIRPMLAVNSLPFDSKEFIYEVKWDGYRCLAYLDEKTVLQSRNGMDISASYPDLVDLHHLVAMKPVVLDGEIIAPGEAGKASFSRLQARGRLIGQGRVNQAARQIPAVFIAFDVLYCRGENIMGETLMSRKTILQEVVRPGQNLLVSEFIEGRGLDFFQACVARDLEGVVAKAGKSAYLPGKRSVHWRKFRHTRVEDFVIAGYEPGSGSRRLGALILAEYEGGALAFRGKVGTGFGRREEETLLEILLGLEPATSPFPGALPGLTGPRWVRPELVCAVEYLEKTPQGHLRHPSYRGLRWDKEPGECSSLT